MPNLPKGQIRGIKYVPLGNTRYYDDKFHLVEGSRYTLSGQPGDYVKPGEENDLSAVAENYAVITPLQMDFTDYESLEQIKKWSLSL